MNYNLIDKLKLTTPVAKLKYPKLKIGRAHV